MDKKLIIVLLLCPLLSGWHWFEPAAQKNQQGVEAYRQKHFTRALNAFLAAKGLKPDNPVLKNNTASALYQLKKYQEALEEFSGIEPEKAKISPGDFHYNLGNVYFRMQQYPKALESFKKAILESPTDMDAKKNYELTRKKIREQKKSKNNQQQKQDREQKKNKNQNQQQRKQAKKNQQKYKNIMQYLNRNEKKQLEKKKRALGVARKEKDW